MPCARGAFDPTTYPTRAVDQIKGLQPDFSPDRTALTGLGVVAVNFQQAQWEPTDPPFTG